jgi:peptide/nickel transport system permease protein
VTCGAASGRPALVFEHLQARGLFLGGRFGYRRPIARYILKRLGLSLISLLLLSILVFAMAQVLPGDPARNLLGREAPASQVNELNHELGYDRPFYIRYGDWLGHFAVGDLGKSARNYPRSVKQDLVPALERSLKLALFALIIIVPISIFGGVLAALRYGRPVDRVITVVGLSFAVIPEFVHGIVLVTIFGVGLHWFPTTAGSGSLRALFLPACALALVLFGYIARMARAGTIEALGADYTRTASLKGLSRNTVLWRHVLRNSLLPTITVIATQTGYLFGGLVAIELLFGYPGIGSQILQAANNKDFPVLQSGVLVIAILYLVVTLVADLLVSWLNPRVRLTDDA